MRFKTVAMMFCAVLVAALALTPGLKADEWNKKTTVTFSAPVEIPGVGAQVLPAGTYVFKLLDSLSDRHIVQVFNKDETHVYSTILAIPNYRLKATDKTVMTFKERASGEPEAIRAWFYPGNQWGQEFVYPKARALELARVTHQPILATTIELKPDTPIAVLKAAPIEAVKPTGEEVPVTEVVDAPPAAVVQAANAEPVSLPQTASPMLLVALIGLLSLGAGLAIPKRSV